LVDPRARGCSLRSRRIKPQSDSNGARCFFLFGRPHELVFSQVTRPTGRHQGFGIRPRIGTICFAISILLRPSISLPVGMALTFLCRGADDMLMQRNAISNGPKLTRPE
jgi:hypothetical protein